MKPWTKRLLIAALVLIVVGGLALPKMRSGSDDAALPQRRAADTLAVATYHVRPTPVADRIITTGTLRANEEVELTSETSGKITGIYFREGAAVRQGQLLVKINDADLRAERERLDRQVALAESREARQRQLLEIGGVAEEEYEATRAQLDVLRAEIGVLDARIAKTEIRAPFSGIIGLRYASEGTYITPQTRIATLQDVTPLKIDFSVPERYAGRVAVGAPVVFRVAGTDQAFRAEVYAIEPQVSLDTRTIQVRALTPNADEALRPGGFANVELIVEEVADAIAVPAIAVMPDIDGSKVFVVEDGRVAERRVETGIRTAEAVQILDGLAEGDIVVTSGLQQLRPGAPVRAQAAGPDAATASRVPA